MPFYPDTISFTTIPESVYDEQTGQWLTGEPIEEEYPCRAEAASGNGKVKGVDGERTDYDWNIYLPLPVDTIGEGTPVSVHLARENKTVKDVVKRFKMTGFNAKVWL